jgi:type VI secretion system secreted protein Hcp
MAETVHLKLKAAGSDIQGESLQTSLGRENTIECLSFEYSLETAREAGSGMATGRRLHKGVVLTKRIDKSSPLLIKALTENTKLEASFLFFRPNPSGDGTTEQFYKVDLKEARISAFKQWSPDVMVPNAHAIPPMERVEFVFGHINWTYTNGGVQHEDSWAASK